jgi:hypothetical protein
LSPLAKKQVNHLRQFAFLKSAINISGVCFNDEEIYYGMPGGHKSLAPISSTFKRTKMSAVFKQSHAIQLFCYLIFSIYTMNSPKAIYLPSIDFLLSFLHIQQSKFKCDIKGKCLFDEG